MKTRKELALLALGRSPYRTVSGPIVTFPDGNGGPFRNLTVGIEPVQDLHGYDNPWPAGGWKNLFDKAAVEASKYLDIVTGLPVSASNAYCVSDYIAVKSGISVFIPASQTARRWFYDISKTPTTYLNNPNNQVFTPTEDGYIRVSIKTDVVSLDTYQIEIGSTATPYAPYSNICPISGWTGANVWRTGKNLLKNTATSGVSSGITFTVNVDGSITLSGQSTAQYYSSILVSIGTPTIKGVRYIITGGISYYIFLRCSEVNIGDMGNGAEFVGTGEYITLEARIRAGTTIQDFITIYPMIRLASESSASFAPYSGNQYTIQLGDTVYGGTLDVLSGVLTAYPYYASYNGETLVGPWVSSMDVYAPGTTPTIGAQVVDMGGAGTIYQLTPQQVQTLIGPNALWADTGPVDVEYVYDTGEEGGKLALLLRHRKELLIAMRKGAPAGELALGLSAAPSLGGVNSPAVQPIKPLEPIKPVFGLEDELGLEDEEDELE